MRRKFDGLIWRDLILAAAVTYAGLLVRVHPEHVAHSVGVWFVFIAAAFTLWRQQASRWEGWALLAASTAYSAWFHYMLFAHWMLGGFGA